MKKVSGVHKGNTSHLLAAPGDCDYPTYSVGRISPGTTICRVTYSSDSACLYAIAPPDRETDHAKCRKSIPALYSSVCDRPDALCISSIKATVLGRCVMDVRGFGSPLILLPFNMPFGNGHATRHCDIRYNIFYFSAMLPKQGRIDPVPTKVQ